TMSDSVAVMHEGVFVEEGPPQDLYLRPRSAFTAAFLGETNLIAGTLSTSAARDGLCCVETSHGAVVCPHGEAPEGQHSVWVACRPEGVRITATRPPGENVFAGHIMAVVFAGDQVSYNVAIGAQIIGVKSDPFRSFQDGDAVFVQLPPERCLLLQRADA